MLNVGALAGMHLFFVCSNQTTNEQMKRISSPYSLGTFLNTAYFCCGPKHPSFIDFHAVIPDDSITPLREAPRLVPVQSDSTTAIF